MLVSDLYENLSLKSCNLEQLRGSYAAFIIVMSPLDFLRLTTYDEAGIEDIKSDPFPLSKDEIEKRGYDWLVDGRYSMPFLKVEYPSGRIFGHEGRHRAAMVMGKNGKSFPVAVYLKSSEQYEVYIEYYGSDNEEHEETKIFPSREDAEDWIGRFNSRNIIHQKIKVIDGIKLRGAPARSDSSKWQFASWKVEDFPERLIGEFNPSVIVPKSQLRIGLVKGYTHYKEAE